MSILVLPGPHVAHTARLQSSAMRHVTSMALFVRDINLVSSSGDSFRLTMCFTVCVYVTWMTRSQKVNGLVCIETGFMRAGPLAVDSRIDEKASHPNNAKSHEDVTNAGNACTNRKRSPAPDRKECACAGRGATCCK